METSAGTTQKRPCNGPTAKAGDTLLVHYEGFIADVSSTGNKGKMFDSSVKRNKPFEFKLGAGQVIAGWDQGKLKEESWCFPTVQRIRGSTLYYLHVVCCCVYSVDFSIVGLCLGEKTTLTIPPELGYGAKGSRNIPPNATLRFTIDLVGINDNRLPVEEEPNVFEEMDSNRDKKITYEEMQAWFKTMHPDKLQSIPGGLFEREDKDGDGVISFSEFDGPKGLHEEL
eukprot:CAMPEP_0174954830 /NCGR_PEP_ID=MMETSP0004_2-20121128/646_1 /TAXON_ID=420556 /ORGANISM="Ochromonas sp., Strain CCMP1393" /LENGTH=226 /DNA_ID=CAMNT_0016202695 /DNA_START=183 /DNA_END=864 /DNA_ORIENTATION=-